LNPSVIIVSAGYKTGLVAEKYLNTKLNIRYWESPFASQQKNFWM